MITSPRPTAATVRQLPSRPNSHEIGRAAENGARDRAEAGVEDSEDVIAHRAEVEAFAEREVVQRQRAKRQRSRHVEQVDALVGAHGDHAGEEQRRDEPPQIVQAHRQARQPGGRQHDDNGDPNEQRKRNANRLAVEQHVADHADQRAENQGVDCEGFSIHASLHSSAWYAQGRRIPST
ncbi:MAG: hypothetical protein U0521_23340 [Anaerolineae bacterium]